jgi:hypothetical protein
MKNRILTFAVLLASLLMLSSFAVACPTFEFGLSSTNNGSPAARQFSVSPAVLVRNPSTGVTSYTSSLVTTSYGGQQVVLGYVGSNSYCGAPMFDKNKWYTIKAKQSALPCTETVFRIFYETAYTWTQAPSLEWRSGGVLGSYGRMFVNGGSYPSPYAVGTVYGNAYYKFKYETIYNCEPGPIDKELGE